jgi:hypothetical protein
MNTQLQATSGTDTHVQKLSKEDILYVISSFFPCYGIWPNEKNTDGEISFDKFWTHQVNWSLDSRILTYPYRLKLYLKYFPGSIEEDFLNYEIKNSEAILSIPWSTIEQPHIAIILRKYLEFLAGLLSDIKNSHSKEKIASPYGLTDFVGVLTAFADRGFIKVRSDFQLARHIENNYLYNINKPIKNCKQIISNYRNYKYDSERIEKLINDTKFKIRTIDDKEISRL